MTIAKKPALVNVTAEPIVYDDDATIVVRVAEGQTGHVTITVNNNEFTAEIKEGGATFTVPGLNAGNYTVDVTYSGDLNYDAAANNTTLIVNRADLNVSVVGENVTVNDNSSFIISNVPSNFKGSVNITVDGITYSGDVKSLVKMSKLAAGIKEATAVFYGDDNYNVLTLTVPFTVSRVSVDSVTSMNVTIDDVFYPDNAVAAITVSGNANGTAFVVVVKRITENKDIVMDYRDGTIFKVKVYGDDGAIAPKGEIISFYINGIYYVGKVDSTGHASLKITLLPKKYTIITEYKGFRTKNKVTIKQILKPVKKLTVIKKTAKSFKLKATLKYSNGKPLKGKKITFKIKGKTYKAKTNKKGVATVKIKKNLIKKLKKGKKYKVVITYAVREKYGNDYVKISDRVKCYVKVKK